MEPLAEATPHLPLEPTVSPVAEVVGRTEAHRPGAVAAIVWSRYLITGGLILIWLYVLIGLPLTMPTSGATGWQLQLASWLTFLALFITPGWLAADLLTWRLGLDWLERLALAFPLGITVLALPGMAALLFHATLAELSFGWILTVLLLFSGWLVHAVWQRRRHQAVLALMRWTTDEWLLLLFLVVAFAYCLPILNLYKIDGDAYAVGTFAADALAGLPLNAQEPLFGTDLGPGVRMAFNQSLPMAYLWSSLSYIDPITLTASASRAMIALWVLLATYAFGKAAGAVAFGEGHGRRFGLFMTALQLLILLAAPFLRGDNVSLFFFERTTADKYMVPMTMLPLVFAFTLRYLAAGDRRAWWTAAVATFAVSTIHPLIAAMMALALGAFAGFHWLLHVRQRVVFQRSLAVIGLTVIAMGLPLIQLVLARGEAPLAPSYPTSMEGWPVGYRRVAALPFLYLPTLDIVGPLPDLTQWQAADADSILNPFLLWRFDVNMNRRRLLLFDLDHYLSDPNIFLEPPYLLALLLLPFLLWRIRTDLAAQFAVSVTLAILFVLFNPYVTPLIGALVMPWILWRFVWIFPYTLILALLGYRFLCSLRNRQRAVLRSSAFYAPFILTVVATVLAAPAIAANQQTLTDRTTFPYEFPVPARIFDRLQTLTATGAPVNVMADQDLSVTLAAYVAKANVIAHRVPTTSEIFPADQQTDALQRLIDQARFFRTKYITADTLVLLQRYGVAYVIAPSDSELNLQMQLATAWFTWLEDDKGYSLYIVHAAEAETPTLKGNAALLQRLWPTAEAHFQAALSQNANDLLAQFGLAEIAHMRGQFTQAVTVLQQAAAQSGQPYLHYRLGQLYAEVGQFEQSIAEFTTAQQAAPTLRHFQLALGDVCLTAGRLACAQEEFAAVAAQSANTASPTGSETEEIQQMLALANLWRERGQLTVALPLYQTAATRQPTLMHQLMLANTYLEMDQFADAEGLLATLRTQHPFSSDVLLLAAQVKSRNAQPEAAIALYQQTIRLQDWLAQESTETRLALAATLLDAHRPAEAQQELDEILWLQPNNATAYALQGELYGQQGDKEAAAQAYRHAFALDPTQVHVYFALNNQLGRRGEGQTELATLLARAMKANPDEAVLALALGDQLEESGRPRSAIAAYHSAIDKFEAYTQPNRLTRQSNQIGRAYAYARLAAVSEDMGEIEPAMNYYAAAAAAAPEYAWPQTILGDALRRRGEMEEAIAAYKRGVALDANNSDAYLRLADLYTAKGDQTQAEHYRTLTLQTIITATSQTLTDLPVGANVQNQTTAFRVTTPRTDALFASDETTSATSSETALSADQPLAAFLQAVQQNLINGENTRLFRLLAHLYTTDGQVDEVHQLYQTLIKTGIDQGWDAATIAGYYQELGDLYLAQNQPTQAVTAYEEAIALDVWWPQLHVSYARALDKLGETERALTELRQTVDLAPGYVEAPITLANALEQQGEDEEALAITLLTSHIHPGNAQVTLALAHLWQRRGQWARAEEYYRKSMNQTPGNPDAYVDLAALLIGQQRYDEAQTLLTQVLALDRQKSDAYLQAGLLAQQQNQPTLANRQFAKALQMQVESPAISLNQIDALERTGNYTRAETFARARLQQHPDDPDLLLRLATLQQRQGHFTQALNTLLAMERLHPNDSRVAAAMAELHQVQGRPADALTFYRKAIAMKADVADYYLAAAELWVAQGYPSRAVTLLQNGVAQVDRPAPLYAAMATIELTNGHLEAAHKILERARDAVGDKPEIVVAMGSYLTMGDAAKAEEWYQTHLAQQPQAADIYSALGNLYLRQGKTAEALATFQQVVELQPASASYYVTLAGVQVAAKQTTEAIASLQQAIALEPTLATAYANLAALYAGQKAWDEARAMYQQALAVAPTDGLAYVQYAQFLLARGEKEAADAQLAQADQLSSTAAMFVSRAALYQSLRRETEAEKDLRLALQKEPGNVDALLALNRLYRDQGELAKAAEFLTKAVQLVPALGDETLPGVSKAN